jgi:hypothetical protein
MDGGALGRVESEGDGANRVRGRLSAPAAGQTALDIGALVGYHTGARYGQGG